MLLIGKLVNVPKIVNILSSVVYGFKLRSNKQLVGTGLISSPVSFAADSSLVVEHLKQTSLL